MYFDAGTAEFQEITSNCASSGLCGTTELSQSVHRSSTPALAGGALCSGQRSAAVCLLVSLALCTVILILTLAMGASYTWQSALYWHLFEMLLRFISYIQNVFFVYKPWKFYRVKTFRRLLNLWDFSDFEAGLQLIIWVEWLWVKQQYLEHLVSIATPSSFSLPRTDNYVSNQFRAQRGSHARCAGPRTAFPYARQAAAVRGAGPEKSGHGRGLSNSQTVQWLLSPRRAESPGREILRIFVWVNNCTLCTMLQCCSECTALSILGSANLLSAAWDKQ